MAPTNIASLPTVQKAWRIHKQGAPRDVLSLDEIPVADVKPGQVLVKVEAAALNPVGYKMMHLIPNWMASRPAVAEQDFAGTIVFVSPALSSSTTTATSSLFPTLQLGQKVFGVLRDKSASPQGTLCEYIALDPAILVPVNPNKLSIEEAAGLGTVGITAVTALENADVKDGQSVFVLGGSSSVGQVTIQMLKLRGCTVGASCSGRNVDLVKSLGADRVYDYTEGPVHSQLASANNTYDAIIDCVGEMDVWRNSTAYLREGGIFAAPATAFKDWSQIPWETSALLSAFFRPAWLGGVRGRTFKIVAQKGTPERSEALYRYVEQGVKVNVEQVYKFSDPFPAFDRLMTGRATGKLVISVP